MFRQTQSYGKKILWEDGITRGVGVTANNSEENVFADAVICSVPAPLALNLIPRVDKKITTYLKSVEYGASPLVAFGLEKRVMNDLVGIAIPQKEGLQSSVFFELTNKYAENAPPGSGLMVSWPSGEYGRELMNYSEEDIAAITAGEVRACLPEFPEKPLFSKTYKRNHAVPQYRPGQVSESEKFFASESIPGLFFAGDYLSPAMGIEGAVITGQRAAQSVMKYLSKKKS